MTKFLQSVSLAWFFTISDLSDFVKNSTKIGSVECRRPALKIAVIDDSPFTPQVNLQNYGYKFDLIGDIKKIDEIHEYQLILCDIKGVGAYFGGANEGAVLIAEIKNRYPEKIIIAYSASTIADPAVRAAKERADAFISKDVDIEEWIAELDRWSVEALDPSRIWLRLRRRFVELDLDTKQILMLEDAFVRSALKRDSNMANLRQKSSNMNLPSDARAIIQGLVSSAIFKILVG